jgi:hypothetical protein
MSKGYNSSPFPHVDNRALVVVYFYAHGRVPRLRRISGGMSWVLWLGSDKRGTAGPGRWLGRSAGVFVAVRTGV